MSETPKLLLQKDGPIGWIIFNQPEKRNAVSLEMWQLMPDYVQDLANDDAIRVVVLRGAGDQAFVAGADISQFKERRRNMADQEEYGRISARGQDALGNLTKPLLAMIHGYCVGGGVGIAIGCDMRIASDEARFGIPAARLGLGYHYRGMEKLMNLVGPAYVKEIFFTARTDFSAQDALRMGLVDARADRVIDGRHLVVTPGFLNGHMHISYAHAVRGIFPDNLASPLAHVFKLQMAMTEEEEYLTTLLGLVELVKNGTVCFVDPGSTKFPDACLQAYQDAGLRVILGECVSDREAPFPLPRYSAD